MKVAVWACNDEYGESSNRVGGKTERPLRVVGGGMDGEGGDSGDAGSSGRVGSGVGTGGGIIGGGVGFVGI